MAPFARVVSSDADVRIQSGGRRQGRFHCCALLHPIAPKSQAVDVTSLRDTIKKLWINVVKESGVLEQGIRRQAGASEYRVALMVSGIDEEEIQSIAHGGIIDRKSS